MHKASARGMKYEIFPRSFAYSQAVRQYFYMMLFCLVAATPSSYFSNEAVMIQLDGFFSLSLVILWVNYFKPHPVLIVLPVILGSMIGTWLSLYLMSGPFAELIRQNYWDAVSSSVMFGGLYFTVHYFYSRSRYITEKLNLARTKTLETEKLLAEGRLQILQSQIEPHFIVNALANTIDLIDSEPDKGKQMLRSLSKYIRAVLKYNVETVQTLGEEVELLEQYLRIQQLRFGDRLHYQIDVDSSLYGINIPPMLLQPLVENAVVHGIEPSKEGGLVSIKAQQVNDSVCIWIEDSGVGFLADSGGGVGLLNVQERLNIFFSGQANFQISRKLPHGTRIKIEFAYD